MLLSALFSGKLFILVGPAGTGKNTLMEPAIRSVPGLRQLPTATTRTMRPNETDGRQHYFISRAEFERMIAEDDLLEWQIVHGTDYYGMVRSRTEEALAAGEIVIADIDYLGAQAAQTAYPHNVVTVFITPPGAGELVERMTQRGEQAANITRRLLRAPQEFDFAPQCSYVILNDGDPAQAAERLIAIIQSERAGQALAIARAAVPALRLAVQIALVPFGAGPHAAQMLRLPVQNGELPQQAALQGAASAFAGALPPGAWQAGDLAQDNFIPPDALLMERDGDAEVAVYVYHYCLRSPVPQPLPAMRTPKQGALA